MEDQITGMYTRTEHSRKQLNSILSQLNKLNIRAANQIQYSSSQSNLILARPIKFSTRATN